MQRRSQGDKPVAISETNTYDPENNRLQAFYDASARFRDSNDTPTA